MGAWEDFNSGSDQMDILGISPRKGVSDWLTGADKKKARAKKRAEEAMKAEMAAAAKRIADQRPLDYAARIDSLNQAAGMFEPANNMLDEMYGAGSKTNLKFTGDPTRMPGYKSPAQIAAELAALPPAAPVPPRPPPYRPPPSTKAPPVNGLGPAY